MLKLVVLLLVCFSGVAQAGAVVGTLTGAGTCVATDSVLIPASSNAAVSISGTWAGTIAFNSTADGVTYVAYTATQGATSVASTTANGQFELALNDNVGFCLDFTTYTSGSATISLVPVPPAPHVSTVPSVFASGAVTTVAQIKASQGSVYQVLVFNSAATATYAQVFFKPSASVTLGTTAPDMIIPVPVNTLGPWAVQFATSIGGTGTGLSVACTTTPTGAVTQAASVSVVYQ